MGSEAAAEAVVALTGAPVDAQVASVTEKVVAVEGEVTVVANEEVSNVGVEVIGEASSAVEVAAAPGANPTSTE